MRLAFYSFIAFLVLLAVGIRYVQNMEANIKDSSFMAVPEIE